ncbi:MAG: hypothetical protein D6741_11725 [Planctomycetota bacterium]|nr:MAG: hypothetical protein D6741_11725 [Planctomycetota bacterium]
MDRRRVWFLLIFCVAVGVSHVARGIEFRVEHEIYVGTKQTPSTRGVTLFRGDLVYDFLESPQEIMVFDLKAERVVLLNPARREMTELEFDTVDKLIAEMVTWASKQDDPYLQFLADPVFEMKTENDGATWIFDTRWLTYEFDTVEADSKETLTRYWTFSDLSAKVNPLLSPGSRPPLLRLEINKKLRSAKRLPVAVRLREKPKNLLDFLPRRPRTVFAKHQFSDSLSVADKERIRQVEEYRRIFRSVPFNEYLQSL